MKKLTKEEAEQIRTKPNGRMSRTRMYLLTMQPGEIILLERADWKQRTQVPHTYCMQLGRKTKRQWTCATTVDGRGWVIERVK